MIFYSAKDISSRSCMQIKMFMEHPDLRPKPTELMKLGSIFQDEVAKTYPNVIGQEMGSTYFLNDMGVSFAVDIVCDDKFIETKTVVNESDDNTSYLHNCIFQCAIYKALISMTEGKLSTAKFYANLGNDKKYAFISPNNDYILVFGSKSYKIDIDNVEIFSTFIKEKMTACRDWSTAKQFDSIYKHKEFDIFNKYITFTEM